MRYRLEIPRLGGGAAVREFVRWWVHQPAVREIVELDGGTWPRTTDLDQLVSELHEFSSRWDFRGGASERLEIGGDPLRIDGGALNAAAADLGLAAAKAPASDHYEHGVVLGGTALANIYRVQRLYDLIESGVAIDQTACLTALRALGPGERELVEARHQIAALVANARTEFDVMVAAVAARANVSPRFQSSDHDNPNLATACAQLGEHLVLAAASADPSRRANTMDNYGVYRGHIKDGDSVLVVTSSIYLPYQFFVALQAIGWHRPVTVEAIGFPPEWMQGVLTGPANVLQEMRSALYGASMTLRALSAAH